MIHFSRAYGRIFIRHFPTEIIVSDITAILLTATATIVIFSIIPARKAENDAREYLALKREILKAQALYKVLCKEIRLLRSCVVLTYPRERNDWDSGSLRKRKEHSLYLLAGLDRQAAETLSLISLLRFRQCDGEFKKSENRLHLPVSPFNAGVLCERKHCPPCLDFGQI